MKTSRHRLLISCLLSAAAMDIDPTSSDSCTTLNIKAQANSDESPLPATDDDSDSSSSASSPEYNASLKRKRKPKPEYKNIYSTVAGQYSIQGRILPKVFQAPAKGRDTTWDSSAPLTPAEVLFKQKRAPDRYEEPEHDPYGAHRWLESRTTRREDVYRTSVLEDDTMKKGEGIEGLMEWKYLERKYAPTKDASNGPNPPNTSILRERLTPAAAHRQHSGLPSSDLCKALHRYASAFYTACENKPPGSVTPPDADLTDLGTTDVDTEGESSSRTRDASATGTGTAPKPNTKMKVPSSFASMDETALLAMAILLEETARAYVGPTSPPRDRKNKKDQGEGWRALMIGLDPDGEEVDPFSKVRSLQTATTGERQASPNSAQLPGRSASEDSDVNMSDRVTSVPLRNKAGQHADETGPAPPPRRRA